MWTVPSVLAVATIALSSMCAQTFQDLNVLRSGSGLDPLPGDAVLAQVAQARADDMALRGYFSHDPPDGCNFSCLEDRAGLTYPYRGEILSWNNYPPEQSEEEAIEAWRNSPPHLAVVLGCSYDHFGVGVAAGFDGRIYYVAEYAGARTC